MRRILTPLIKLRACREARKVAGDAMEMRGGNGYIEEWIEPRLLRETHLGSIWEGTTNIIALDVVRAAAKSGAHRALARRLEAGMATGPEDLAGLVRERLAAGLALVDAAGKPENARSARQAATGLYYATAAALFLEEAGRLGDPVRVDLARLVLAHKLTARDPLAPAAPADDAASDRIIDALAASRVQAPGAAAGAGR
jgi:acyl-CoA dehydrogenase